MSAPKVSVIIPVFNGAAFLSEAVESVRRQNYPSIEIVVVDDGSTDETPAAATALEGSVRYFRQDNGGAASARNKGLAKSSGDIITFLGVDDVWSDDKLALQVGLLVEHPDTDMVMGYLQHMMLASSDPEGRRYERHGEPTLAMSLCSSAFRRAVFDRVGGFDESQAHADDWDWFVRARELKVASTVHTDVVHYYRHHESNLTRNVEAGARDTLRMVKKSLDRRRNAGRRALPATGDTDGDT